MGNLRLRRTDGFNVFRIRYCVALRQPVQQVGYRKRRKFQTNRGFIKEKKSMKSMKCKIISILLKKSVDNAPKSAILRINETNQIGFQNDQTNRNDPQIPRHQNGCQRIHRTHIFPPRPAIF